MGFLNSILKVLANNSNDKYHLFEGSQKGKKTSYLKKGSKSLGPQGRTVSWFKW